MAIYLDYFLRLHKPTYRETFEMCNVVPQLQSNNAGIWLDIEQSIRNHALNNFKRTHIYTGPLYIPGFEARYLKNLTAVPTHLFKVVQFELKNKKCLSFGVVVPNTDENKAYIVSIEFIERASGLLFPEAIKQNQSNRESLMCIGQTPTKWHLLEAK